MDSPFSTPGTSKPRPESTFGTPESQKSTAAADSSSKEVVPFKRPPSPSLLRSLKRRKAKVLDEEEYVEKIEGIIERDFFPELEMIRARTEYIEASERNDSAAMRRLKERFSSGTIPEGGHASSAGLKRPYTPETFDTPQEDSRQREEAENKGTAAKEDDAKSVASSSTDQETKERKESLDQFLARHTSEDNESFNELQEEQFKKFRVEKSWMFKDEETKSIEMKSEELRLPAIEEQAQKTIESEKAVSQPLSGWTYKNVNAVFYNPEGVDLTPEELLERKKKDRKIVLENTRFKTNPWKNELQKDSLQQTVHSKMEKDSQKVGVDGKALSERPQTPSVNGFKFLRMTPSPMLAGDESPLMTWGEVESTPYRLEGCDTPLTVSGGAGGPSFSIQNVPKRDRIAHELAEKNSKFYRDKKGKAIQKARLNIKTPKGSLTERVAGMSPAAQRLATSKLGIRLGTDKALRASYTPSPARLGSMRKDRTPTPSSSRSKGIASTPKGVPASPRLDSASLTDNLLNLPSSSSSSGKMSSSSQKKSGSASNRPSASDFL